jgi:hypothetical protein
MTDNKDLPSEKVVQKEWGIGLIAQKTRRVREQFRPKAKELGQKGLQFLDHLATIVVDSKNGKQKGYLLQTVMDLVGLPTVLSVGDFMGALRGYKNIRNGLVARGIIELVTAVMPGIPTGPAHKVIDLGFKISKDADLQNKILIASGITIFLVLLEILGLILFERAATTISLILAVVWVVLLMGTFMVKPGKKRTVQPTLTDKRHPASVRSQQQKRKG